MSTEISLDSDFLFPQYFPLHESLSRKFETIQTSLVQAQSMELVDQAIQSLVKSTKQYTEFILDGERSTPVKIDEQLLSNNLKALTNLLKTKYTLKNFNDSLQESRSRIRQESRTEQPLNLETLQAYQNESETSDKRNFADAVTSDYSQYIQLHNQQNSFNELLRSSKDYQYVKNVSFILSHPEEALADEVEDDELAVEGGKVSLKDPISLKYFENPVKSRRCQHTYEQDNILSRIGEGQNTCPIDGCRANVSRQDLQPDELMKLRVTVHLAVQHKKDSNIDRL